MFSLGKAIYIWGTRLSDVIKLGSLRGRLLTTIHSKCVLATTILHLSLKLSSVLLQLSTPRDWAVLSLTTLCVYMQQLTDATTAGASSSSLLGALDPVLKECLDFVTVRGAAQGGVAGRGVHQQVHGALKPS